MGANRPSPWSEELRERVKTLWTTHSSSQIAEKLNLDGHNFTRNSIVGLVNRLGLSGKDKTEQHKSANRGIGMPRGAAPRQHKRRVRIIAANGNSNHLRIITSRESALAMKLRCIEIMPLNLTLEQIGADQCRYLAGDDFLFCGHPSQKGSSFCAPHHALCWVAPRPSARPIWRAA